MAFSRRLAAVDSVARGFAGALALAAFGAQAAPFELVYSGTFNTTEALNLASAASPSFFTASTPFTVHASFDDSSPNLAPTSPPGPPPFAGFRAYAPSAVTIDIGGARYSVESISSNAAAGVTVAIFDQTSVEPGRYGIGLIADPVHDGAGFVGDFKSASPNFTVNALTPTVFTDYAGVGYGSGVCVTGSPPACPHEVTPWVLHDGSNAAWNLTLGNYSEDYGVLVTPGASLGPLNTASISAVPEPASAALMLAGLIGLGAMLHRQRPASSAASVAIAPR